MRLWDPHRWWLFISFHGFVVRRNNIKQHYPHPWFGNLLSHSQTAKRNHLVLGSHSAQLVLCCSLLHSPIRNVLLQLQQPGKSLPFCMHARMCLCVPIVSGRCCSMLEDSSRSSKASQPEISVSSVSIRFLAKSKYRNWRSFPSDCSGKGEGEREEQLNDKNLRESVIQTFSLLLFSTVSTESVLTPGIDCRELLSSHSSLRLWICSNTSG